MAKKVLKLSLNILSYDALVKRLILLDVIKLVKYNTIKLISELPITVNSNLFTSSCPFFCIKILDAVNIVTNDVIPKFRSKSYIFTVFNDIMNVNIIFIEQ